MRRKYKIKIGISSRTVSPEEYSVVCRKVAEEIGEELLNHDEVLRKYKNWTNSKEWHISTRQKTIIETNVKKQADPLAKDGIIGCFCRTYDICHAIDTFLPHIYEKSEISGRYNYIPSTFQGGLVIYDDKFAYSNHATDIACDKLMNAFDIVRIHKFSYLDDKENSCQSSFKAMQELALSDEKIKLRLAKEHQIIAQPEFSNVQ